jgi:hypothetical protein
MTIMPGMVVLIGLALIFGVLCAGICWWGMGRPPKFRPTALDALSRLHERRPK